MRLTIYYGKPTPLVAIGKHQCHLLGFAEKYPQWHTYRTDKQTLRAIDALEKRGCLTVNRETCQFKIRYP